MSIEMDWEQTLFTLILHAGNARSLAKEAAQHAAQGEWAEAEARLSEANTEQAEAHNVNAQIIRAEAGGKPVPFSVLLVHSMDLLLLAWSEIDHTEQLVALYRRIEALEQKTTNDKD